MAGNEEVLAVGAISRPIEPRRDCEPLQLSDALVAFGALGAAAGALALALASLRTLITAAREATDGRNYIERAVEVQTETVAAHTRKVSTMRFEYHERWPDQARPRARLLRGRRPRFPRWRRPA